MKPYWTESPVPGERPMFRPFQPGQTVIINTPENGRLHGTEACVKAPTYEWGAYLFAPASATYEYRATWDEMLPLAPDQNVVTMAHPPVPSHRPKSLAPSVELPVVVVDEVPAPPSALETVVEDVPSPIIYRAGTVRNGVHSPGDKEMGFTGDICDKCGGSKLIRVGPCLQCTECGEGGACG